jgi:pimeloyl-ACP methyl ester carboxylesterase
MTTALVNGININYEIVGEGPVTLLFMHCWGGSGRVFKLLAPHLAASNIRCILLDLRGHGDSDKVDTGYTNQQFAMDVLGVADAVGADKFVMVGFSMSGKFAQYVSVLAPERVLGQILISACPASEFSIPPEAERDWVTMAGNAKAWAEVVPAFFFRPVAPGLVWDHYVTDFAKVPAYVLQKTFDMCRESFVSNLASVNTRTLVLGGLHDEMQNPRFLMQQVVAPLRYARLVTLDAAHMIPLELPAETAALIEAFLAGLL